MADKTAFQLQLLGSFRLSETEGQRIEIVSKKGMALVALLAMAPGGERARSWLQDVLWGSRGQVQAQSSLRRELANLRRDVNGAGHDLIGADKNRIWIALDQIAVDARAIEGPSNGLSASFLEGIDLPGEEGFEDWLRDQRQALKARHDVGLADQGAQQRDVLDVAASVPGFSGRPAIAVLPLDNLTDDNTLSYLSDGISEELIERLSRLRWLPVIARSASFAYRDKATNVRDIGVALGARYVLGGHIRRSDNSYHLSLDMADIDTGYSAFSHKSDLPLQLDRKTLDGLIVDLVGVLDMRIDAAEKTRASRKPESELTVDDLIWRARWHVHRYTAIDAARAEALLNEALGIAPNSSEALVQMTYLRLATIWTKRQTDADLQALRQLAQRAIAADGDDGRAYLYAGMTDMWMRKPALALPLFEKALELNPSLAFAHHQFGSFQILCGNPEAAIAPLKLAFRLAPNDEQSFMPLNELAVAHLMLGNLEEAIALTVQSLNRRVAFWYSHVIKINALARLGRLDQARAAVVDLMEIKPGFSIDAVDWVPFVDSKWNDFIRDGFQMAELN